MFVSNNNYSISKEEGNDSTTTGTKRYQSKYLHISLSPDLYYKDIVDIFSSKGVSELALFKGEDRIIGFCGFDRAKDYRYDSKSREIVMPLYINTRLGKTKLLTISEKKGDFFYSVESFREKLKINKYEPLLYSDKTFFYNLKIKDLEYFEKIVPPSFIKSMRSASFKEYRHDFNLCKHAISNTIDRYNALARAFNDNLPSNSSEIVNDFSRNTLTSLSFENNNIKKIDHNITNVDQKVPDGKLSNLDLKQTQSSVKSKDKLNSIFISIPSNSYLFNYKGLLEDIAQKTEHCKLDKNIDINISQKVLYIFDKDLLGKDLLQYIVSLDKSYLLYLMDVFIKKHDVNLSIFSKKKPYYVLKLVAMYLGKKSPPKSSDPNTWIINRKNHLPEALIEFFKKYVKKL